MRFLHYHKIFRLFGQTESMKSHVVLVGLFFLASCGGEKAQKKDSEIPVRVVNVPAFNADSAYFFIQKQVDFGPRIPNSPSHRKAGDYFIEQFKKYGAIVTTQDFVATTFDNQRLNLRNVIASFNPDKQKRILLAAHWDTRPFADKDAHAPDKAFDGANDGGSGVGILLEIARVISTGGPPDVGIDMILFDGEDWGDDGGTWGRKFDAKQAKKIPEGFVEWWCLGSQYWSKNKHKGNYSAYFGILLDMTGGKNAQFAKEGYSKEYAPNVVDKIWKAASAQGFSHIFINQHIGGVTDDHVFVNEFAKIPMVNIISFDPSSGFGDFHHTQQDNMDIISKETLEAVGKTVLHVIYYE
jgi:Zn-dependent M28 family amino/carboxypeptidase